MSNMFDDCKNEQELELKYMILTSPENISWDGELSLAQQKSRFSDIVNDYEARAEQLHN